MKSKLFKTTSIIIYKSKRKSKRDGETDPTTTILTTTISTDVFGGRQA